MRKDAEFDVIVYGASGFTGRLVAEHLQKTYGADGSVRWAMAGRSLDKLAQVRDEIGAPEDLTALIVADSSDRKALDAMVRRGKAVATTVGPYQLYGDDLVAACAEAGTDYLDLCGEVNWMAEVIREQDAAAKASGARICLSCGFDSIPFELGVIFAQMEAAKRFGAPAPRVNGRVRAIQGGLSGGTAASGAATMAAAQKDPAVFGVLMDPYSLTPGFRGPDQPNMQAVEQDPDLGAEIGPFMMSMINSKNVLRSNVLMGQPYGADFLYDERTIHVPGAPTEFTALGANVPKPGEGPSKAERDAGFYDLLFVALAADGRRLKASVKGDKDPGYGSTSKMLAEAAICLVRECPEAPGGVWTPGAVMGARLIQRLQARAGLSFTVEG
jgi:short subunit dehydrogenase-like uncharacterized protein